MHIHIPTVSDATDSKGARFKVFNIYINGIYHGSLRYSQLLNLHTEVKAKFDTSKIVDFPEKIFKISDAQLQLRRRLLERYVHCLLQNRDIGSSSYFLDYMLATQLTSSGIEDTSVDLEIYLCNEKSKMVTCSSFDRTCYVLEATCKAIGIPEHLTYYFALFLEYSPNNMDTPSWTNLHVLTDLQSPYLTMLAGNRSCHYKFRLAIKRWFFDPNFVSSLLANSTSLNMLYIECIADIEQERVSLTEEVKQKLSVLKKAGKRSEFVELLSQQSTSGYKLCDGLKFDDVKSGSALIGGKEIIAHIEGQETIYGISKLRCWKMGVLRESHEHFFSFEFEYSRQKFIWVTVRGVATILLSQCINQAVEEYILRNAKKDVCKPGELSYSTRPVVSLPPLNLASSQPPGEDLHMVQQHTPLPRTDSNSSEGSEPSIETQEESTPLPQQKPINGSSHTSTTKAKTATKSKGVVGSRKKEDTLINPSFVSDDDL